MSIANVSAPNVSLVGLQSFMNLMVTISLPTAQEPTPALQSFARRPGQQSAGSRYARGCGVNGVGARLNEQRLW